MLAAIHTVNRVCLLALDVNAPDDGSFHTTFLSLLPWGIQQRFFGTPFGRLRMTLVEHIFWFISDTIVCLLASIFLTTVLFYFLAKLASLCHSEPANGRAEESLCYSLGLFVSLMVWNETSRFSMLSIATASPLDAKYIKNLCSRNISLILSIFLIDLGTGSLNT